jgi:plastocyanin
MKKLLVIFLMGIFLSVFLASCGGSTTPTGPSKSLDVIIGDFYFLPKTFTVPAGEQISFTAKNNGAMLHSFVIMKAGFPVVDHYSDADIPNIFWKENFIRPGQSVKDSFMSPSDPGEYQILCDFGNHFQQGMIAKLIVVKQP